MTQCAGYLVFKGLFLGHLSLNARPKDRNSTWLSAKYLLGFPKAFLFN